MYEKQPTTYLASAVDYELAFDKTASPNVFARPKQVEHTLNIQLGQPEFGPIIELVEYQQSQSKTYLVVTLQWQALTPIPADFWDFVHLINPQNGMTVSQSDQRPDCGNSPTYTWMSGQTITDRHLLLLNDSIQKGEYRLITGLYLPKQQIRLRHLDEQNHDFVELSPIGIK